MACGTGTMLEKYAKQRWHVSGFDKSLSMVRAASHRVHRSGFASELWVGDMRQFSLRSTYSAVLCLYDSINYCRNIDELVATLRNVAAVLQTGGVFLFDVCTQRNCRLNFINYQDRDRCGGFSYIRKAHFDRTTGTQENIFLVSHSDWPHHVIEERHVQKIYSLQTIEKTIRDVTGMEIIGKYDGMTRRRGSERSERVHYLLRA